MSGNARQKDSQRSEAFLAVAGYIEHNDDEQVTITYLINKMNKLIRVRTMDFESMW